MTPESSPVRNKRAILIRVLMVVTLVGASGVSGAPAWAGDEDAQSAEEAPRQELPSIEAQQAAATERQTRTFERQLEDGSGSVRVTVTTSASVDGRILDYLEETLQIVVPDDPAARGLWNLKAVGEPASGEGEIEVSIEQLGTQAKKLLAWLPPDGLEFVRPGVLRVGRALATGLADSRDATLSRSPTPSAIEAAIVPALSSFERATGTVYCIARDGTPTIKNALPFVRLEMAGQAAKADDKGDFELKGRFSGRSQKVTAVFKSRVGSTSPTTRLEVMDDLHQTRSETRTVTPRSSTGDVLELGEVILTSADCELWRLGTILLEDYHQTVGNSPPDDELRLKRWSGVWDGTPHTYYDYVVLTTNFTESGNGRFEANRRRTLFHEFGHSIRHVADGDEFHWAWDNFRWAYARSHDGCEIFNTQYAFNEGWANYWEGATLGAGAECDPSLCSGFLDWNEDQIGNRLLDLADTACRASDPPDCSPKQRMVEVLETYPGEIHSLWAFETRYCLLFWEGNSSCKGHGLPDRSVPASCPPGFHDDGATCRLVNIKAKPSYGRGVGTVPTVCAAGQELDAGLCYDQCRSGYEGVGPVCWKRCPPGFRDDGAFCAKPAPYGRGAGYPWQFGDPPFDLGNAKDRCEDDHGAGKCEQNGLIYYPKCRSGFHAAGCCICSPNCPSDLVDIGVSCVKRSYGRGVGTVPTRCPAGKEYDAGLCYTPCRTDFNGVGPVCWGQCDDGFEDHGATCYRPPNILVKY